MVIPTESQEDCGEEKPETYLCANVSRVTYVRDTGCEQFAVNPKECLGPHGGIGPGISPRHSQIKASGGLGGITVNCLNHCLSIVRQRTPVQSTPN